MSREASTSTKGRRMCLLVPVPTGLGVGVGGELLCNAVDQASCCMLGVQLSKPWSQRLRNSHVNVELIIIAHCENESVSHSVVSDPG